MENGTFQNQNLSHLDFTQDVIDKSSSVATPNASSSFHTLLTQNEDLAARLRVTLKRLAMVEQQNHDLQENMEATRSQSSAIIDQLLIWKEKEKIWKEKEQGFERSHRDQTRELTIEIDILRQTAGQLEKSQEDLERYKKYHEKIKTSVKPYIQKLKGYTKSLFEQTQTLNSSLIQKELLNSQLESKLLALKEDHLRREETFQVQMNELISMFEDERQGLRQEIVHIQESNEVLHEKTRHLDRSLERQDELENLIVSLRRSKEEHQSSHHAELIGLKQQNSKLQQELQTFRLRSEDLNSELLQTKNQLQVTEVSATETMEQLTSLRYLWSQKAEESEKLKLSLNGLEKLNLELSQKLKVLRAQD